MLIVSADAVVRRSDGGCREITHSHFASCEVQHALHIRILLLLENQFVPLIRRSVQQFGAGLPVHDAAQGACMRIKVNLEKAVGNLSLNRGRLRRPE